jgi:hypothetical protein
VRSRRYASDTKQHRREASPALPLPVAELEQLTNIGNNEVDQFLGNRVNETDIIHVQAFGAINYPRRRAAILTVLGSSHNALAKVSGLAPWRDCRPIAQPRQLGASSR